MDAAQKTDQVRKLAEQAGFEAVGIALPGPITGAAYFNLWLDRGRQGEMDYLARTRDIRLDSRHLLEGARSIIVVADQYKPADEPQENAHSAGKRGRIARYAWGRDYHRLLRKKLHRLADKLHETIPEPFQSRVCVDTAPIVEREAAAAAGLGWIGKNTLALNPKLGSYFFLGEILTTLELVPSKPMTDHCGSCTRCLDACPTQAFIGPYKMDPTRCIAYLTIEHRTEIPADLQPKMGDWVFGCDVCQEVCPFNRKSPPTSEPGYQLSKDRPLPPRPLLEPILNWTDQDRQTQLKGSAMKRATKAMWQRNATIALNNARQKDRADYRIRAPSASEGSDS